MTVKDIVAAYLIEHGFDGLYSPEGDCGCTLGRDFIQCDGICHRCVPAYRVEDDGDDPAPDPPYFMSPKHPDSEEDTPPVKANAAYREEGHIYVDGPPPVVSDEIIARCRRLQELAEDGFADF